MSFIEAHRERFGVEPICTALQFAPATYYAARSRPSSARAQRDELLKIEIERVFGESFGVYGAEKLWRQLNREGIRVARCTVQRLMRDLGLQGAAAAGDGDAPRSPTRRRAAHAISLSAASPPADRTVCGSRT